tara:strand:- start:467 stop:697 length:231 start_codon:yes stop_codon:yes gene_type:complete
MRLKSIVLTDLAHDRLVAYEELERVMNKKGPINKIKSSVKFYLKRIVKLNGMISEWEHITQTQQANTITKKIENNE